MVRQVPAETSICMALTTMTVEVDPYKKPKELVELSPKGLVPALRLNSFSPPKALNESTIIMEYLEE
jgi:glutathione S-transferase